MLCYIQAQMFEDEIKQIEEMIQRGLKVYWFSSFHIKDVGNRYLIKKALNKGLLRFHHIETHAFTPFFFLDGISVPTLLLNELESKTTFNKNQYLIEHNCAPHLIVKAGAGTGKTTVLLDYLMFVKHSQPEISYSEIALITFTREAAANLRKKLEQRLYDYYDLTVNKKYLEWVDDIKRMKLGTIHSFAKDFLENEGLPLGWLKSMTIRGYQMEKRRLIEKWIDVFASEQKESFEPFKSIPQYKLVKAIVEFMKIFENKAVSFGFEHGLDFGKDQSDIQILIEFVITHTYEELHQIKRENQELEMSDLVRELRNFKEKIDSSFSMSLSYVLVDEFQDTDDVQVQFLSWLIEQCQSELFIVGDVKQSIYRFRGADYTAFQQMRDALDKQGKLVIEIPLVKNYRSAAVLLNEFDKMFKEWNRTVDAFSYDSTDQLIPTIETSTNSKGVKKLRLDDLDLRLILDQIKGDDTAILVRTNQDVQDAISRCESLNIYCENRQKGTFYRSLPVRECYMLLRRFTHPNDWVNRYALHQSSYYSNKIESNSIINRFSPEKQFIQTFFKEDWLDAFEAEVLRGKSIITIIEKIMELRSPSNQNRIDFYHSNCSGQSLLDETDLNSIKNEAISRMKEYQLNLDKLLFILKQEFPHQSGSLMQVESFLRMKMAEDRYEDEMYLPIEETDRIKVMTVHKSKGLEFNNVLLLKTDRTFINRFGTRVFLVNKDNKRKVAFHIQLGNVTFRNDLMNELVSLDNKELIGEEARLLYVALTRAKKQVYADIRTELPSVGISKWADLLKKGEGVNVSS